MHRRDLELLAARLADDLVVDTDQVIAQLGELRAIAFVGSWRQPILLDAAHPAHGVFVGAAAARAGTAARTRFRSCRRRRRVRRGTWVWAGGRVGRVRLVGSCRSLSPTYPTYPITSPTRPTRPTRPTCLSEPRRDPKPHDPRRQNRDSAGRRGADGFDLVPHVIGVQQIEDIHGALRAGAVARVKRLANRMSTNLLTVSVRSSPRGCTQTVSVPCGKPADLQRAGQADRRRARCTCPRPESRTAAGSCPTG